MVSRFLPVFVGLGLLAGCAAPSTSGQLTTADNEFLMEAAAGNLAEIAAGHLAEDRGGSPAVRQFGTQMVSDHTAINQQLTQIAAGKGVTLPHVPDAAHRAVAEQLATLSGQAFDRQYVTEQITDHQQEIRLFTTEAQSGTDPTLRGLAAQTLPMLQQHLQQAQALAQAGT